MSSVDYFLLVQNISESRFNEYVAQVTHNRIEHPSQVRDNVVLTAALLTQEISSLFLHRHDTLGVNSAIVNHLIENTPDSIPIVCDFLLQKHSAVSGPMVPRRGDATRDSLLSQITRANTAENLVYLCINKINAFSECPKVIEYIVDYLVEFQNVKPGYEFIVENLFMLCSFESWKKLYSAPGFNCSTVIKHVIASIAEQDTREDWEHVPDILKKIAWSITLEA
jgi:hypothetical protein